LPIDGGGSPGDDLDEPGSPYMASDDSDGGGDVRIVSGNNNLRNSQSRESSSEHLVKPSHVKGRKSRAQGDNFNIFFLPRFFV
jgi:hypothetical protein